MRIYSQNSNQISNELARTTRALNRSLARLATGKRINSAGDNPADYSASVQLTSHIRGVTQGIKNINSALSVIQTADSVLESQMELLQRMREIGVQSGNGLLNSADRENLNNELQSLLSEFQRLTTSTELNGMKLLDGSFGTQTINISGMNNDAFEFGLSDTSASEIFTKTVGTGTFNQRFTLGGDGESSAFDVGDFNHDGILDYVSSDGANRTMSVYQGLGDGAFNLVQTYVTPIDDPTDVTVSDFNGDGILDIALGEGSFGIRTFRGLGDGRFELQASIADAAIVYNVVAADVNNDSIVDLIYASGASISTLIGNGDGTFQTAMTFYSGSNSPISISAGDLNGDGNIDLFYGNQNTTPPRIAFGNGSGTFQTPQTLGPNVGYAIATELVDVDNDNDLDALFLTSTTGEISLFLNNGSGNFSISTTISTGSSSMTKIMSADFNNDGHADLLVGGTVARALLFTGRGGGTFSTRQTILLQNNGNIAGSTIGDFNNDGAMDFIGTGDNPMVFQADTTQRTALTSVNVLSAAAVPELLDVLDNALLKIQEARSQIGALHNRLESATSSNLLLAESLEDARNRLEDTDIASETAELVRFQILQQTQVAVMAQANLQMQTVIALLG